MKNVKISIISPVYKAKKIVPVLLKKISSTVSSITNDYEIILVDDGCPQNSWEAISEECIKDHKVKGIKLSRNFGQHAAITAGLELAKGEWIVVMDCDLQDKPENISQFYQKAIEGHFDIVVGKKVSRKDNIFRKIESFLFYKFLEKLTGVKLSIGVGNFGIYNRKVIASFLKLSEEFRSFGIQIMWLGFNRFEFPIESNSRYEGKSSYTFITKWKLAVNTITSFSNRVLSGIISTGFIIFLFALTLLIIKTTKIWFYSEPVPGWTSIMLSIYMSLGIIISCIGIVGVYVGKTFTEVKKRPIFIINETLGLEK